jgi:pimeloyl-ACP methyl ester carboxylesterase
MAEGLTNSECKETSLIEVDDVKIELIQRGTGRPIVFLHPAIGLNPKLPVLSHLAEAGSLYAPSHPGFGESELPRHFSTVEDIAYLYLDLFDQFDIRDAVLIGVSFGAWIAAEMAIKSTERISHLVMADPVGIKVGRRDSRDIADMFMLSREEFDQLAYADTKNAHDMNELSDAEIRANARNWKAAAPFGWLPYMHDPKLRHRLHWIRTPSLFMWGDADQVVSRDYVEAYSAMLPNSRVAVIPGAGHYPHIEKPEIFSDAIARFMSSSANAGGTTTSAILLP